jgi:hypothetical protein
MTYKTLSKDVAARLAAMPIDYEWDATIGNGFIAASEEDQPRLAGAIETVNIHGAADLVVGAIEWCLARVEAHVPAADGQLRLQAAWAATVDPRYSTLGGADPDKVAPDDLWTRPERRARAFLRNLVGFLEEGDTAKVRGTALGTIRTSLRAGRGFRPVADRHTAGQEGQFPASRRRCRLHVH